jgi:hydrogenase/urease accessory protein HupE
LSTAVPKWVWRALLPGLTPINYSFVANFLVGGMIAEIYMNLPIHQPGIVIFLKNLGIPAPQNPDAILPWSLRTLGQN